MEDLQRGKHYTRDEIHDLFGGNKRSYLPTVDGQVVCGCFTIDDNLRAPCEIDVGDGPIIIQSAEILIAAGNVIPVFVKQRTNAWEFVGHFRGVRLSRDPADLDAFSGRRTDAIGVLYLEEVDSSESVTAIENFEISAVEGRQRVRLHWRRERKPSLIAAKKRIAKAAHGCLVCEACRLTSASLPEAVAEACFEAHHLLPLADLDREVVTRLDDIALLCANCHRMIHSTDPLITPSDLGILLQRVAPAPASGLSVRAPSDSLPGRHRPGPRDGRG